MNFQFLNFKKSKSFFIFAAIFGFLFSFLFFNYSKSYSPYYTHPDLTEEMAKFYNLKTENEDLKIKGEEIKWMREGAEREDEPPRWINHFYNPIHKIGWTGKHFGSLSEEQGYKIGADMAPKPAVSSINWVENQEYQSSYGAEYGNQTWQMALFYYVAGYNEEAFIALGHTLHLIEDLSVPDHTRNDSHAGISGDPGSPYEDYTKEYTNKNKLIVSEDLKKQNKDFYKFSDIKDYFEYLANYTNKNFFSEDTISNDEFSEPDFNFLEKETKINGEKRILFIKKNNNYLAFLNDKINKFSTDDKQFVLPSYRERLFPEAVLTGAGVIDLFFKEAEYYKKNPELLTPIMADRGESFSFNLKRAPKILALGFWDKLDIAGTNIGIAIHKAKEEIKSGVNNVKNFATDGFLKVKSFFDDLINGTGNQQAGVPVLGDNEEKVSGNSGSGNNVNKNSAGVGVQKNQNQENQVGTAANNQNGNTDNNLINNGQNIQKGVKVQNNQNSQNNRNSNLKTDKNLNGQNLDNIDKNKFAAAEQTKKVYLPASHDKNSPAIIAGFGGETQFPSILTQENSNSHNEQNYSTSTLADNPASSTPPFTPSAPDQNNGDQNTASSTDNSGEEQNNSTSTPPVYDNIPPDAPKIISPENLNQIFTNSQITFSGTAEPNTILLGKPDFPSEATTSVSGGGEWSLTLNLNEGTTTINFYAVDSALNISSSTSAEIFIDSKAPEISSFFVLECAGSISSEGCLIATTTVNLIWSAGASAEDLDYFELSYVENIISTTSASAILILNDNASHIISLRTKDTSGNFSEPRTIFLEINTKPIIINEIAWAGTGRETSNDEWIELYNRTNKPINLDNFVLYASDLAPYINLQNQILAKGYYLLERTRDDTVLDILADQFFTGAINNIRENLFLVYISNNGTTTIDYTYSCSDSGRWCGGSNDSYRTMERYNSVENIWGTHLEHIYNGKNANGGVINGTPKARNSLNYLLSTTTPYLQADTILKKENSPYFIPYSFTVPQGKKLTIEQGVVIKIKGGSGEFLDIYGELYAQGAESEPIVFTSFYDDEYGGDLNGDGGETTSAPGSWAKIILENTSSSTISYAKFRYGGKHYGHCCNSMVKIHDATSTITNSVFENSYSYGLELMNSNSYVSYNIFRNNNNTLNFSNPTGLRIVSGAPKIINNIFENNFKGIDVSGGSMAEIEDNIFNNNTNKAIYVIGNDGIGNFKNNSGVLAGGDADGIYITDFKSQENATTTLYSNSFPYIFTNNPLIRASSALVVKPNILIKNSDMNRIEVFGSLITEGANPGDIIFTSLYDPLESYWFGISANPGSFLKLSGVTIKNGGRILSLGAREREAALYIDRADAKIENSLFENNYKNGIIAINTNPNIRNTEFKNHLSPALDSRGITYYNSEINLENADFRNNFMGIYADAASVLGAVSDIIFEGNTGTSTINLFP